MRQHFDEFICRAKVSSERISTQCTDHNFILDIDWATILSVDLKASN
jgi:hypothetical protein